ncbi:MAG: GNAT family N-acetyltransferase [Bacteroidota bacterium]
MQLLDTRVPSDFPPSLRVERVGMDRFAEVRAINEAIFNEARVINQLDRRDLVMLLALLDDTPVGFKVGYGENRTTFYSAKGGTLPAWRRRGLARLLLAEMMQEARVLGYLVFAYDTFPNMHPGMTVLGLAQGFRVTAAGYNASYRDYRLRFEKELG